MQELMLLSFSFSQSLGSRIRRYRGDPNAGNFSGRGEHRALGRLEIRKLGEDKANLQAGYAIHESWGPVLDGIQT